MTHGLARTATACAIVTLVALVSLGAGGCVSDADRAHSSAGGPQTPVSAVKSASRADISEAQKAALAYVEALRSRDASVAASLMTPYRRAETRAKGWKADVGWWKSARVTAVMHPGRYVADERSFAELYAERFGHPPYNLVVVNVRYALGDGAGPGDTDFVVTRDSASAPWLVHDFGGALRSAPASPTP